MKQAEQAEQVNIKNGNSRAEVSLIGGTPVKFAHLGMPIIYPQRIMKIGGEMKKRGGIPICFPVFGRPKPGLKGLDRHGWLRKQKLAVVSTLSNSVVLEGKNQYRKTYPWRLEYKVVVAIVKDGLLKTELQVMRMKDGVDGRAPVNPAFHPYFANSSGRRGGIVDTSGSAPFGAEIKVHPDGNPRIFRATDDILIDLGLKKVRMSLEGFTKEARLVLWSDSEDYFCVEPVLADPDGFNTQDGRYLEEEESLTLICLLEVM